MNEETAKIIRANTSPRYRRLEELWRWVEGRQYEGRPNWFNDEEAPRWERAPCIVYPVVNCAIDSNTDLVLGEGRFPRFSSREQSEEGEGEKDREDRETDDDSADELDRYVAAYHKKTKFRSHSREAFCHGQGTGTAVGLHGVRNGRPTAELIEAKTATPKFNVDGAVTSLDIQYPYVEEYRDPQTGDWKERVKLYRRTIDESTDTTYKPAEANENGLAPRWEADADRTYAHGLGFCPVIWYAFMKGCVPVNVVDGKAIHRLMMDEIHQHDIAVSSRHTCALLAEPQIVEIGVKAGYNPTGTGRPAAVISTTKGGEDARAALAAGTATGAYMDQLGMQTARRKGPGFPWQYPDPATKVEYLTIAADVLKAQDDNARDILFKIQDSLGVVFVDQNNMKLAGTTSGKALEAIRQRQIDRCDQYREDIWDNFLEPSIQMQLRIAATLGAGVKIPGSERIRSLIGGDDAKAASNAVRAA